MCLAYIYIYIKQPPPSNGHLSSKAQRCGAGAVLIFRIHTHGRRARTHTYAQWGPRCWPVHAAQRGRIIIIILTRPTPPRTRYTILLYILLLLCIYILYRFNNGFLTNRVYFCNNNNNITYNTRMQAVLGIYRYLYSIICYVRVVFDRLSSQSSTNVECPYILYYTIILYNNM